MGTVRGGATGGGPATSVELPLPSNGATDQLVAHDVSTGELTDSGLTADSVVTQEGTVVENNLAVWSGSGAAPVPVKNGGTWTTFDPVVTLVGGAGNTVPVYSTNTGRYCRVGMLCFVEMWLTGDGGAEGAGSGNFNVALPLPAGASLAGPATVTGMDPFCGVALNGSTTYFLCGYIPPSATTIQCRNMKIGTIDTEGFTGVQQNNATRSVHLKFFYEIA